MTQIDKYFSSNGELYASARRWCELSQFSMCNLLASFGKCNLIGVDCRLRFLNIFTQEMNDIKLNVLTAVAHSTHHNHARARAIERERGRKKWRMEIKFPHFLYEQLSDHVMPSNGFGKLIKNLHCCQAQDSSVRAKQFNRPELDAIAPILLCRISYEMKKNSVTKITQLVEENFQSTQKRKQKPKRTIQLIVCVAGSRFAKRMSSTPLAMAGHTIHNAGVLKY